MIGKVKKLRRSAHERDLNKIVWENIKIVVVDSKYCVRPLMYLRCIKIEWFKIEEF